MYISEQSDFAPYIETPEFAFGDSYGWTRGQSRNSTAGGFMASTDRGYVNRLVSGLIPEVDSETMQKLKTFFVDDLKLSRSTFWISIQNTRYNADFNPKMFPWKAGNLYGIAVVKAGQTILGSVVKAGQLIPSSFEVIGPLRLTQDGFRPISVFDGIFEVAITAVVENEN